MPHVVLLLFGPPRIERDGEPLELDTRKAIALASYLAITGENHTRDALVSLFWPLSDQSRGRAALRRTLSTLKKALGEGMLEVEGEHLALRPNADFRVDVDQFLSLQAKCQTHGHPAHEVCPACLSPLSQAVALYRADFMTGFSLSDSPAFDEWQTFQTESLRLELAWTLERLVRCHCDRWEFEPAIAYARRWVAIDPLNELPHYLLMQIYTWAGQRSAALRQYEEYTQILELELGLPPEEDITQLYQAVRENQAVPLPSRSAPAQLHNLPFQPTPFVGREEELVEIGRLLDHAACRLLTLSGPGGIGKTRLAVELAAQHAGQFPHGVCFVPLAHLSSAELLVPAIAEALRLSFHGRADPKEQLLSYLQEKELLLLLDNFEHLLEGGGTGLLVEILSSTPNVKLLVTSREHLSLQWEWPFEVQGLRFPQDIKATAPEQYSAIKLFLQSARRAHPGFSLTEANKPFVIHICRSLEGMPLGIELAAAWVEVSSCQHIAQEIERNLGFLTTSRRDVPERHRSLNAAFEHSWRLLSSEEKSALSKLSVFRSGFRREAAERTAGASLMHLSTLMHKSFLRRSASGRYEMLEVLRQHARDKLGESTDARDETHDCHCTYYADYVHHREESLRGARPQQALDEIGEEIDNVRAAWHWGVAHRKQQQIADFLEGLHRFYEMRSWFQEAEDAFGRAVRALTLQDNAEAEALLARIRARQGWFCLKLSRFQECRELLGVSVATLRHLDMPRELALALNYLGSATAMLGDFDKGARLFQESIALYKAAGDRLGMASGLNNIGIVALIQERYDEAKLLLRESLTIREEAGHLSGMVDSLTNLGLIAETQGEYGEAKQLHQKCFGLCIEIGDRWGIANSLCNLAFSLHAVGENLAARRCFQESLGTAMDLPAIDLILEDLIGIATLLSEEGDKEHALELVAGVLAHPAISGKAKERADQLLSRLESQLAPETFVVALEQGKKKDIRQHARVYSAHWPAL